MDWTTSSNALCPDKEDMAKWLIYFSTVDAMTIKAIIDCYKTRFKLEFCFREGKRYVGLNGCQLIDLRKQEFYRNVFFASIHIVTAV